MSQYMYDEKPKRGEYELADFGTRFIALAIDTMILGLIGWVVGLIFNMPATYGGFIIGAIYNAYFWTQHEGQTPGKRWLGLRVVKKNGEPMDVVSALVRYIGYYINSFIFGIGWLWPLFNSEQQGWHDLLSGTYVVRA